MTDTVLYTTAEAAARLKMGTSTLKALAQARAVPCRRFGRLVRFSDADLAAIIAAAEDRPQTSPIRSRRAS